MKVRAPLKPRNPEKFKAAQKCVKSDFRGPPKSNPKSNLKSNFLTQKVTQKWLFRVRKLLFGLLLGLLWGGTPKVTFQSLLSYFEFFGVFGALKAFSSKRGLFFHGKGASRPPPSKFPVDTPQPLAPEAPLLGFSVKPDRRTPLPQLATSAIVARPLCSEKKRPLFDENAFLGGTHFHNPKNLLRLFLASEVIWIFWGYF